RLSRRTAPCAISPLPLPDALPIFVHVGALLLPQQDAPDHEGVPQVMDARRMVRTAVDPPQFAAQRGEDALHLVPADRLAEQTPSDRKSTRLNSSHVKSSYAVVCLK